MKKILIMSAFLVASASAIAGGNIEAGKAAVTKYNCASCHAKDNNFSNPIDPSYPKLAGQHADYLAHALKAYQRGANGANGRANAIMGAQAKPLSSAEIENISAYLHSLHGDLLLRR